MSISENLNEKGMSNRRSILISTSLSLSLFAVLYFYILHKQSLNKSPAAIAMPDMHMNQLHKFWSFPVLQASGLVGMLMAYLAIMLGTQQSRKTKKWLGLDYREVDQLHRHISIATLILVIVHAIATLYDAMGDSWKTVFFFNGWANPKTGWPAAVWGYNLGVFGFYAILVLGPTFYLRRKMGVKVWKYIHRFIILFYIASLWHTLILGVELGYYHWLRPIVWIIQLPVLYFLVIRFGEMAEKNQGGKNINVITARIFQLAGIVAMIAVVVLVFTGHSGFIKNNFTGL